METLSVVQARRTFSELMARVAYRGQRVVVERKGRPMMALVSIEDLRRLEALDEDAGSSGWLEDRARLNAPSRSAGRGCRFRARPPRSRPGRGGRRARPNDRRARRRALARLCRGSGSAQRGAQP